MASYVAADYTMQGRKADQQRVPDGWGHVGRWWGVNGMKPHFVTRPVTHQEFRIAKALIRNRYATETGRCTISTDFGSAWVMVEQASDFVDWVMGFIEDLNVEIDHANP
jgi:hypothetical protein